jgi:hypothetical protein
MIAELWWLWIIIGMGISIIFVQFAILTNPKEGDNIVSNEEISVTIESNYSGSPKIAKLKSNGYATILALDIRSKKIIARYTTLSAEVDECPNGAIISLPGIRTSLVTPRDAEKIRKDRTEENRPVPYSTNIWLLK